MSRGLLGGVVGVWVFGGRERRGVAFVIDDVVGDAVWGGYGGCGRRGVGWVH